MDRDTRRPERSKEVGGDVFVGGAVLRACGRVIGDVSRNVDSRNEESWGTQCDNVQEAEIRGILEKCSSQKSLYNENMEFGISGVERTGPK